MNGMARVRWIGDGYDVLGDGDECSGCRELECSEVVVKSEGSDERCLDASRANDERWRGDLRKSAYYQDHTHPHRRLLSRSLSPHSQPSSVPPSS